MPIYAYKCANCGHSLDVLQKVSDAPLTVCPSCGLPALSKQVTAAGFQLKGSGWYVTDFRDGGKKKDPAKPDAAEAGSGEGDAVVKDGANVTAEGDASAKTDAKTDAKTKVDAPKSDASANSGSSASTPTGGSTKASVDATTTKASPPATGGAKGTPG